MGVLLLPIFKTLALVLDIYFKVVIVEIAVHWLLHFKILSVNNKYAEKFVEILKKLTEPVYAKIRAKVPPFADFDASPFILLLILYFIGQLLVALSEAVL
ncbi:MAG: YggT family protein [Alphaproteobacteria bacterium]|nr:YggT family protein [Alphaproteobacteria bacterium]